MNIFLTYEKPEREQEILNHIIKSNNIAGLVIFSSNNNPFFFNAYLKNLNAPCVFVDRLLPYLTNANFVTVDNYGGAFMLGKQLISKGVKNIACISMLKHNHLSNMEDRINGFRDSHLHHNNLHCFRIDIDYHNTENDLENILQEWEKDNSFPDAVFACNHLIISAYLSLLSKNKKWQSLTKKQILSCFDDLPYFDWINKPIISVEQPIPEIAFYCAEILLKRIENPQLLQQYSNIILPVKLKDRTTTAK
ncbi:MAG: hypothetical protein KatS3mg027_1577 [Bacteroidia bacterium]|nr:MAG: hypothetical protein KatS3mg027_1577 [Bacteroidia bacterium]